MHVRNFLYLFFIDIYKIRFDQLFKAHEEKEPGYAKSWMNAYIYAFGTPKQALTSNFINNIHSKCMAFKETSNYTGYKTKGTSIDIFSFITKDSNGNFEDDLAYSATANGLLEFITYWFFNQTAPVHKLSFVKNDTTICIDANKWSTYENEKLVKERIFDLSKDSSELYELFIDVTYTMKIDSFTNVAQSECLSKIHEMMEKEVVQSYNKSIATADTDDQKIKVIVTHVQRIAQLHPYEDGNIRTCYVLLNKLLKDNGLSLTLFLNPNRLNCCSVDELTTMVKDGQEYVKKVLEHTESDEDLMLKSSNELHLLLRSIRCQEDTMNNIDSKLINSFITTVLGQPLDNIVSLKTNTHKFFTNLEPQTVSGPANNSSCVIL